MKRRPVVAALISIAALGCHSDSTAPVPKPFQIIAGGGLRDTVDAVLPQAVVVEARDSTGAPRTGLLVTFSALFDATSQRTGTPPLTVSPADQNVFTQSRSVVTDPAGRASMIVKFGTATDTAKLVIAAPQLSITDTVRFTILPGNATSLRFTQRDTAIYVSGTATLPAATRDRYGNFRTDSISYLPGSSIITVDAAGHASGTSTGRTYVVARYKTLSDTSRISIVPHGTLAVSGFNFVAFGKSLFGIATIELDGSAYHPITYAPGNYQFPDWSALRDRIVFQQDSATLGYHLYLTDLDGTRTRLVAPSFGMFRDTDGHYSPDRQWIYFSGWPSGEPSYSIFRIHPDGTGLERVIAGGAATEGARQPHLVNGSALAFVTGTTAPVIRTMNLTTGAITNLNVAGEFPRYSPDGRSIAFVRGGENNSNTLFIMNADGSGQRALGGPDFYWSPPIFSPDGQWIIARSRATIMQTLVSVADGSMLPLPYSIQFNQAAFQP